MKHKLHKQGKLRANKILYPDGIGCCVWYPLEGSNKEYDGICFDFSFEDIDDFIKILNKLKKAKADKYKEEKD